MWAAALAGALAAGGTAAAAIYAAVGVREEQKGRLHAQADRVGAWVTAERVADLQVQVTVSLMNTGRLPAFAVAVLVVAWPDATVEPGGTNVDQAHVLSGHIGTPPTQLPPGKVQQQQTVLTASDDAYSIAGLTTSFLTGSPVQVRLDRLRVRDSLQRCWLYYAELEENFLGEDPNSRRRRRGTAWQRALGVASAGLYQTDELREKLDPLPPGLACANWALVH